jgi:hypothetical protein
MRVTVPVEIGGMFSVLSCSLDSRFAAVMGTTLGRLNMPGAEPVARFTDRKTAIGRIWRALQPQAEKGGKAARRDSRSRHRPVFRAGSKAARVCTLLCRPQGATLNEIRSETGWQAHTVRGFISRNLSKQGRKVRSFEREGERVYRLKL